MAQIMRQACSSLFAASSKVKCEHLPPPYRSIILWSVRLRCRGESSVWYFDF